jgi:hypothetical protein
MQCNSCAWIKRFYYRIYRYVDIDKGRAEILFATRELMHTNKSHDMYIDILDLDNVHDSDCIYIVTSRSLLFYLAAILVLFTRNKDCETNYFQWYIYFLTYILLKSQ